MSQPARTRSVGGGGVDSASTTAAPAAVASAGGAAAAASAAAAAPTPAMVRASKGDAFRAFARAAGIDFSKVHSDAEGARFDELQLHNALAECDEVEAFDLLMSWYRPADNPADFKMQYEQQHQPPGAVVRWATPAGCAGSAAGGLGRV